MEIKRIRIRNFEHAPMVREKPVLTYRIGTTDGKKFEMVTTGDWLLKDVVDEIVRGLTDGN